MSVLRTRHKNNSCKDYINIVQSEGFLNSLFFNLLGLRNLLKAVLTIYL